MKPNKLIVTLGAIVFGVATISFFNEEGLGRAVLERGNRIIYEGKGVSVNSPKAARGYLVSASQDSILGFSIKRELYLQRRETSNLYIPGAYARYFCGKWTIVSNTLPREERTIFGDPSKLFTDFWKETH